ncbi:uncharacterized protein [Zea mays]|uniref:Uncharacterized protein n=1 Tax=Zea mays TaxID=4577 RepID=B6T205_MAIZE|nr:uncharacterized protein LOC100275957 isoform 1 [Zea mays]XP_023158037.1 uncharacterized protein LOC111589234 isoform X3 [Zea mays]ACG31138.1 hypothetical protein [Zea mays]|eukprot:NP_001143345.1 uncharacterized protein LOC100275957 isoform 1 [Zea mays]
MARSLRPVVDLRVTKNPEPAEDPAPSPIVWPNALAPSSSSTPPPSRPAIHRSADRRATAAMGFHRAAITQRGHVPSEEQVGTWNLKSQVKSRYHRMRRVEDAVMSS